MTTGEFTRTMEDSKILNGLSTISNKNETFHTGNKSDIWLRNFESLGFIF